MPSTEDLVHGIRDAYSISRREEDEAEPYKNKYQAADLLRKLLGERAKCSEEPTPSADGSPGERTSEEGPTNPQASASRLVGSSSCSNAPAPSDVEVASAAARIRCGLILLETDLLTDGETSIEAGLPPLEQSPDAYLAWLLESYNALGALYSERGDLPVALRWLQRAEQLYQRITGTGTKHAHLALPVAGPKSPASPPQQQEHHQQPGQEEHYQQPGQQEHHQQPGQQEQGQLQESRPEAGPGTEPQVAAQTAPTSEAGEEEGKPATDREAEAEAGASVDAVTSLPAAAAAAAAASPPAAASDDSAVGGSGARPPEAAAGGPTAAPLHVQLPDNDDDAVQAQYTQTLYYLAQVHGHMKSSDRSALYCAATLYRQLSSGKYDLDTWVNNCLQLGGYYAKVHAFGLAMYCHAAAQAVAERDTAAGAVLGEDIAANIKLATARVYGMRLAASHSKHVEGKELEMHYPDVSYFPDYLRFPALTLPSPDSFHWGPAALATNFEEARELLNNGMPYFKDALSYYQLDGWVTDHVGIVMDMSNMFRCLAGFEPNPARAAAMHRCRAQLLEPLSGALNPDHYPGLSRSIDLELAHVYREISDVRELQGGQAAKVSAAAASAAKYYHRFLRSFASGSGTGDLPDRVELDNEPYFLMASFGLGRMLHRMRGATPPPPPLAGTGAGNAAKPEAGYEALVLSAHRHLRWTSEYVRRHGLEKWTQEAEAAEELSELLVEQMRLRSMAAARRGT